MFWFYCSNGKFRMTYLRHIDCHQLGRGVKWNLQLVTQILAQSIMRNTGETIACVHDIRDKHVTSPLSCPIKYIWVS